MKQLMVIFGLLWCFCAVADEVIPPAPANFFNDYAHVVSRSTSSQLDTVLKNYERASSNQIVVAVFPKMESDAPIKDYTLRIANAWKVGQNDNNHGVTLFVFIQDRKMFMQVGTGLEKVITKVVTQQILETQIVPMFKQTDYDGGLMAGVMAIIGATKGANQGNSQPAQASPNAITNTVPPNASKP